MKTVGIGLALLIGWQFWEGAAMAQAPEQPGPCTGAERRAMDFWIGDWELTWADGQRARTHVEPMLDGCALKETFEAKGGLEMRGASFSAYDRTRGRWVQTWVDDQGGVLTFDGGPHGRDMVLYQLRFAAEDPYRRIVFEDVSRDGFTWRWQRSLEGRAWEDMWVVHYARLAPSREAAQ
ncbi:MAG: hypothetical protein K2P95_03550 [Hyphomonadaceae bacterium]|nr:hypothetical protein [Hyphomonadaceae bacterium]